jgi:hypothetical protein
MSTCATVVFDGSGGMFADVGCLQSNAILQGCCNDLATIIFGTSMINLLLLLLLLLLLSSI